MADEQLPADPAKRFEARVHQMTKETGRNRTWCTQRVREQYPDEYKAAHGRKQE